MRLPPQGHPDAAPRTGVRARLRRVSVPFKATVLLVFILTTVPVLAGIIHINYQSSDRVVRAHAAQMVERFRADTLREIMMEFRAIKSLISTAAELGQQAPDLFTDSRALLYFFTMLKQADKMLNVYVGLEDGTFRQARRIHDPNATIHGTLPPEGADYAYRLVEQKPGGGSEDRYIFLKPDQTVLGDVAAASGYDPRQRPWYQEAVAKAGLMITDPELFWAFGLVGFTVAQPYAVDGQRLGVVAADVTLDRFSQYLAQKPVSPNSLSYLLDDRGQVLAASDGLIQFGNANDSGALTHVADVENRAVALAYGQRRDLDGNQVYNVTLNGRDFIVGLSSFEEDLGKPWRLFVITPLSDFTEAFNSSNRRMVLIGLAAVVVQLTIITVIASYVASPLQRLSQKVERIQSLERAADLAPVRSPVREIAVLSQAVETLDTAVQAFARFVPVALVRQLLKSDNSLKLGGQSRFLTILFCDVEAFSTLAERIAARDLLGRVSALLGGITRRVHEEKGTIDKFVGDGVMAFWGAPTPLTDHAFRACVAALAIQRDLRHLNQEWRAKGAPEMQLRVGIHSDVVLVGNVGSDERMSYTVLGDGVNIAARLEGCNKMFGTRICISQDTFREAGDQLCTRPIDEVQVKGRRSRITIYELLGAYGAGPDFEPSEQLQEVARLTQQAFDALVAGDPDTALARYRAILVARPDDPVALAHVDRLAAGLTGGSAPDPAPSQNRRADDA